MTDLIKSFPIPVLGIVIFLLVIIVVLIFVAFFQGREISVGSMKIGGKPAGSERAFEKIEGRRLFQHKGFYPIDIKPSTNRPSLNSETFVAAINHFLHDCEDRLAVMDLVYLREDNLKIGDVVPDKKQTDYRALIQKYGLESFQKHYSRETQELFHNTIQIVNDLGDTLRGVHFEVLLHDVRNPLRSIIAERNAYDVSERRLGDPSTRFVVQYLKHQGKQLIEAMESGDKVAYPKQFLRRKKVKATTTPIHDRRYGLIGILCFNIDIDAVRELDEAGRDAFFDNYVATFGETPEFEKEDAPVA